MLIVSYEEPNNQIFSVATELQKKYKSSSVATIVKKVKEEELLKFARPPLLDRGWLLFCQPNVPLSVIQKLLSFRGFNVIVIQVSNKKQISQWETALNEAEIEYKFSDNYKIPREKVIEYIRSRLHISNDDACFLYKWNNGYTKDIDASIASLEHLQFVTQADIRKYTEPTFYAGLFDVVQFLLQDNKPEVQYKDVVHVLYNYRFAVGYLVNYVQNTLADILQVFFFVETGVLSLENYKQVKETLGDKKIKKLEDKRLAYYIRLYGKVSYEYVSFVKLQLDHCPKSRKGIYCLIKLFLCREGT